jgi:glycogen debranching enzyme
MTTTGATLIQQARAAAVEALRHNLRGPHHGLPRTAGWGYPEPYTRDLMIASLGMLSTGDPQFEDAIRRVLEALAKNQTSRGHIPSLAHDPEDRGASDTTPLFLIGLAVYRLSTGKTRFLEDAARKALTWMEYQSPADRVIIAQQPTSDWRDEQWVPGYPLFINALLYIVLHMYGEHDRASELKKQLSNLTVTSGFLHAHVHEGLRLEKKPYYALWSRKVDSSERFDLLGNSLAILGGIASRSRAKSIIAWVETECRELRARGDLALNLPPNLFPYIQTDDPDWRPRYAKFNNPGEYHNGGIWPFVCGFYVAAMVAAGYTTLARRKLVELAKLVRPAANRGLAFGFNEWIKAQDGATRGQDWQTWSAAMFLYAADCVERGATPFLDEVRRGRRHATTHMRARRIHRTGE